MRSDADRAPGVLAFFAGELRRARAAAKLSQEQLGGAIAYSASLVAMVERGRRMPSRDFTQRRDEVLATTGGLLGRILHDLVVEGEQDVAELQQAWEALRSEALPRKQSADLIAEIAQSWT